MEDINVLEEIHLDPLNKLILADFAISLNQLTYVRPNLGPSSKIPYCWKWLPENGYLFSKNLSDHSTGVYKDLYKGVGVTFEAVRAEKGTAKAATTLDTTVSLNVSSEARGPCVILS